MYFVIVIDSRRPGHATYFDQTEPTVLKLCALRPPNGLSSRTPRKHAKSFKPIYQRSRRPRCTMMSCISVSPTITITADETAI
jgi:hypothetical protein